MDLKRAFSFVMAVLLATSLIGGAAVMADRHTSLDTSPVEDAEAGVVVVGAVIGAYALGVAACDAGYICDSVNRTALAKADALETKTAIHSQALSQGQNNANYLTNVDNDLKGMESIATMEGKNAYIRALENGSAEAVARAEAREAVADYYSARQKMLINQWEIAVKNIEKSRFVAMNTSNVSASYVEISAKDSDSVHNGAAYLKYSGVVNESVPLANGTSVDVLSVKYDHYATGEIETYHTNGSVNDVVDITEAKAWNYWPYSNHGDADAVDGEITVKPPNDNYGPATYLDYSEFANRWSKIQQQNDQIQQRLDDFINVTYKNYVAGEINTSDLIDPYLGAREYDPQGNFDSYSIRAAAAMGIAPPSNLSHVGNMTVVTGSRSYTGILMSAGNHTFEVGKTYNATALNGSQYMLDTETGRTFEVTGEFSLSEIRTPDGSTKESVNYDKIGYTATDLSAFKKKIEQYKQTLSEIEGRQQRLRSAGGTTLIPDAPGTGLQQAVAVVGILVLLGLIGAGLAARGRGDRIEIGR